MSGKIALVMGALPLGSRERMIFAVADALLARGYSVDLLSPQPTEAMRQAAPCGARWINISQGFGHWPLLRSSNVLRLMLSIPALARYLRSHSPDVLLGLSIPPNLSALTARRLAGSKTRIVVRQSNVLFSADHPEFAGVKRRWRDGWVKTVYPAADRFIAVADGVARNLTQVIGIEPERIGVIYNGVDLADIDQKAQAPLPAMLRWPENTAKFVAVGRLVPKKDYPTLLKAFAQLPQTRPSELIILGEGPERARLEALVKELDIDARVQLPGRCDNPYAVLARADGYVLSSISEGMPSALIEALACRCPVVSTRCPSGPEEILEQGRYGALVPVGDVNALRDAMLAVLTNPVSGDLLRRRAEQLSGAHAAGQYLQVIERVFTDAEFEVI